jgi:hypothetical protein
MMSRLRDGWFLIEICITLGSGTPGGPEAIDQLFEEIIKSVNPNIFTVAWACEFSSNWCWFGDQSRQASAKCDDANSLV